MGIEKLLASLNDYLHHGDKKKSVPCDRIDEILSKLEDKKKKLEKKIGNEDNNTKKKRLKTELKIVALQMKKAYKRRQEFSKKCK
ncbi:MAG: hypothetical protein ABFS39_02205 [Pseudomonadota bacterium]